VNEVLEEKNEFVVQDLNRGDLETFHVPRKQRIFLQNEKKNILLRELRPGDHVEMDVDKDHRDMVVNMLVDRPVVTHGFLKELLLPESRLVLSMEEGSTRDDLPVRVPEVASLKLNDQKVKLSDLQPGDRLEISHLSEPDQKKGRVLNTLKARRIVTSVGNVAKYDPDKSMLTVQVGQGAMAGSLTLHVMTDCKMTLNGDSKHDNLPLTAAALKPGDRVSLQHDTEISEITATRSLQFDGAIVAIDVEKSTLTVSVSSGERHVLTVNPKCEITIALDRVRLSDLRQFDIARIAYTETVEEALIATTIDARRPVQTDRWTVVLGTQSYIDTTLSLLKTALIDARLVQAALLTRYAVSPERGALMIDGTKKDWMRQLSETLESARPQTQVLIYITGHAYQGEDGSVYLAPKDFNFSDMPASGLSLDWLADKLNSCPSADKLLILDVSPTGTGRDLKRQLAGPALVDKLKTPLKTTYTIVSCSKGQQSHVWDARHQGLFASILAEAIQGAADTDRDLHLTPQELFGYLKQQSESAQERVFAEQTPVLIEPQP